MASEQSRDAAPAQESCAGAPDVDAHACDRVYCEADGGAPQPPAIWHPQTLSVQLDAFRLFSDPDSYSRLCDACQAGECLKWNPSGQLVRALCDGCRDAIRAQAPPCRGGAPQCERRRFVRPCGEVSPVCRACHRWDANASSELDAKPARVQTRVRGGRGRRRA